MKRGDVVLVALGKPRPAVIVQGDSFPTPVDILICPLTTTLVDAPAYRVPIAATTANGLKETSQLMADKLGPARRDRVDKVIGRLTQEEMDKLGETVAALLGLGR